jgi:quinol-cytochrome oxidoreductase complex cytochrome b subunit
MATSPKQLMEKLVPQKVRELVEVYLKTFFRHDFDRTGLTKSKIMFSNFLLHIQPVKVHKRSLQFRTTLGLGLIAFYLFLILVFSGILLMFHYVPSDTIGPDGFPVAYQRMLNLRSNIFWGGFLRNMHRWAAHAMVLAVWLHMLRVFLTGAYSKPREFNWLIGCVLGLLTVFMSYTGYLLPWDQLAYWGVKVGTEIARIAPGGAIIRQFLLGDSDVGSEALLRFYVLHVAVLPTVMTLLIGWHFWRIRKDGGLAHPDELDESKLIPTEECGEVKNASVFHSTRSYKLVEVVKGSEPKVDEPIDKMVFAWPKLVVRELVLFMLVLAAVSLVSVWFDAPLEGPANPAQPENPAKAPWYFIGLQELTSYNGFIGGVAIPGAIVLLAMIVPYVELAFGVFMGKKIRGAGVWFSRYRWPQNLVCISVTLLMAYLIIVGSLFRGPNWDFMMPWEVLRHGGGH